MPHLDMQELSRSKIDEYWRSLSPATEIILSSMSECDDWTYGDNPDIQKQLTKVMNAIVESKDGFQEVKHVMPALITILNYLDTSTSLWIQIWLNHYLGKYDINVIEELTNVAMGIIRENSEPLATSGGASFATKEDATLFLQRSYVFSKMNVFSQIFSEERLEKMSRLIDEARVAGIIKGDV